MTSRVVIPENVMCTLCSSVVPDEDEYDAHVIGCYQDEYFLLLMCEACSSHTLVMSDGGKA
jgi:hypothetical protein